MICRGVSNTDVLADPLSPAWADAAADGATIAMIPAPLGLQPNPYIIVSWTDRSYGELATVKAAAVHDGRRLAIRLEWPDPTPDHGEGEAFPDGAAITFPVAGTPELMQMGAPEAPIHILQWKARKNEIRSVLATGIGTSGPGPDVAARADSRHADGLWRVVMSRDLAAPDNGAVLKPGGRTRMGIAIWNGSNQERAGIKAVSADWIEFRLQN